MLAFIVLALSFVVTSANSCCDQELVLASTSSSCDRGPLVCTCTYTCPEGWLHSNGNCYKYVSEQKSWADANARCQSLDSELVSIHSEEQNDLVWELAVDAPGQRIWFGLQDSTTEGTFQWVDDGSTFGAGDYSNWACGQPDFWYWDEDCGEIVLSYDGITGAWAQNQEPGTWNDLSCTNRQHAFVCKKQG